VSEHATSDPGYLERWRFLAVDHVQLAMPAGQEAVARDFYVNALGFRELPKPPVLAARGGCWFESGSVQIHLGVEADFRPAQKAHPAVVVEGLDALIAIAGLTPRWSDEIPGRRRCHVDDPFGNRLELIDAAGPVAPPVAHSAETE
jgi:catechol 2,3-dioxygenase-like lactoylglutathione lyase family enzyme